MIMIILVLAAFSSTKVPARESHLLITIPWFSVPLAIQRELHPQAWGLNCHFPEPYPLGVLSGSVAESDPVDQIL